MLNASNINRRKLIIVLFTINIKENIVPYTNPSVLNE